jgi:hypothetical protein
MTYDDELLRRGQEMEAAENLDGAEAGYRQADECGSALGALLLGLLLKRRGNVAGAVEAFRRSETRGHPEARSSLGNLLADSRDFDGARAAYERSIAAGSTAAVLNLGLMLAETGAADEALHFEGARAAFLRGRDLGHPKASQVLEMLDAQLAAAVPPDTGADLVRKYAAACQQVLASVNACLEVANRAVGARDVAGQRPQHPISIETFTRQADAAEAEFVPVYRAFGEVCSVARETAARLLASQPEPIFAEMLLASSLPENVLGNVATAKSILAATFGPSPAAFIHGIREANDLMRLDSPDANDDPNAGNIYRPARITERACPWCAETIKVAAIVCRYCGRDVQAEPA